MKFLVYPSEETLAEMVENSYRNFHAKGVDYLCLKRSEYQTKKVYTFDGKLSSIPEVVIPHDHRYNFSSKVVCGIMSNHLYKPQENGETYELFQYRTPLNGGDGFEWVREENLMETEVQTYFENQSYYQDHHQIHTIRVRKEGTILLLEQREDKIPLDCFTLAYSKRKEPPSLDGLYERFTEEEILDKLKSLPQKVLHEFLINEVVSYNSNLQFEME